MADSGKSAAELEIEVEQQRRQLESRVAEIQERLSPGQLVDQTLQYARSSGGAEFASSLGRNVQANPLPVALTGIGLAWLIAATSGVMPAAQRKEHAAADEGDYATISGNRMHRIGQATDEAGRRYTEFADAAGTRFKAMSDDVGARAGHFTDQTGKVYQGFVDSAGHRIHDFMDETGSRLDDAQGWAADRWEAVQERAEDMRSAAARGAGNLSHGVAHAGSQAQQGAVAMGQMLNDLMYQQPLVGAALAFAIGAAAGAALPRSAQEDALMGEASDSVKEQGARAAGEAYEQGKRQIAETYEDTRQKAAEGYDRLRHDVGAGSTMTH